MSATLDACAEALKNLNFTIDPSRRFPENVFIGTWTNFFFFDSDWMFDAKFTECTNRLFEIEDSACICLSNLDAGPDIEQEKFLYLDRQLTPDAYRLMLKGSGPENGWIYGMDRFACMSEVAQWVMYCEKGNEIAVMAIRHHMYVEHYMPVIEMLKAVHIQKALALPLSFGFSSLPSDWRSKFWQEYTTRLP